MLVDVQPDWLHFDGASLSQVMSKEAMRYFIPLRSLVDAGVMFAGGSDHMVGWDKNTAINAYNPFLGMATAITRRAKQTVGPLHPEESLTREQAIRFYTINNARLLNCDDNLGSLEPGKLADLVVLDTDLLTCPEDRIAGTQVLRTYVGGKPVYLQKTKP